MSFFLILGNLWQYHLKYVNYEYNIASLSYNLYPLQGKLLYCHPPPHINAEDFQPQHSKFQQTGCDVSTVTHKQQKIKRIENVVDKNFFHQVSISTVSFLVWKCNELWLVRIKCVSSDGISVFRKMCAHSPRGFSL